MSISVNAYSINFLPRPAWNRDMFSPLLFNFTPEHAIRKVCLCACVCKAGDTETDRNKVYADVNWLRQHTNIIKKQKLY